MRFQDKVALISAAGAGIGRATAKIIGREGGTVVGVDASRPARAAAPGRRRRRRPRARPARRRPRPRLRRGRGRRRSARPSGASTSSSTGWAEAPRLPPPPRRWTSSRSRSGRSLIAFNLTGTFLFSQAVMPVMKRQRSGKIVNLASIAGRGLSRESSSAYATAKGGIIALTRKLALELGPFGVTVNAIAPSLTLSERMRPHWDRRTRGRAGRARSSAPHSRRVARRGIRRGSSASSRRRTPTS